MDRIEVRVMPFGHLEFIIDMAIPFAVGDPFVTADWRAHLGNRKTLPAKEGTYTWTQWIRSVLFLDPSGNRLLSFDDFLYPPSSGMTGDGQLLFGNKNGVLINWNAL
jgi:hypothetical protein